MSSTDQHRLQHVWEVSQELKNHEKCKDHVDSTENQIQETPKYYEASCTNGKEHGRDHKETS